MQLTSPAFDDTTWQELTIVLVARLRHAAELLDGRMPENIDDVLAECGVSVFPSARALVTRYSCPDVANPCQHVAAGHFLLARSFDADPLLLTTLRRRDRVALLAGLRVHRAATSVPELEEHGPDGSVAVDTLDAQDLYRSSRSLSAFTVRPHPPEGPGALLRCGRRGAAQLRGLVGSWA